MQRSTARLQLLRKHLEDPSTRSSAVASLGAMTLLSMGSFCKSHDLASVCAVEHGCLLGAEACLQHCLPDAPEGGLLGMIELVQPAGAVGQLRHRVMCS